MAQPTSMRSKLRDLSSLKGPFPPFNEDALPNNPHDAFTAWLDDAIAQNITEPHAMTLSTVDPAGRPDARVLILKDLDARGWHFAIRNTSPKGQHLLHNPAVALTFYWAQLGRQVRICGTANQLPAEESAADFLARPESSKISALGSRQSEVLESKEELAEGMERARRKVREEPGVLAEGWTVFAVEPVRVEFWQGASDRMHERVLYTKGTSSGGEAEDAGSWLKQSLWP